MPRLIVSLLGPFQASLDEQPLAGFESDKVRALLAFLMVESGRSHRREELVGLFWPERPEAVARQDLSQGLSNLRRVTQDRTACPSFLEISHQTLRFNTASDHELDSSTFLALLDGCTDHIHCPLSYCPQCMANQAQALELFVGPFLSGFSLKDCPAFDEWMLLQQERLEQLAIQALQRLSAWHSRRGGAEQAIAYTRRWLELDPWQERAHRQLMGILARNGQRNAALEQYEACRAALACELGIEPEVETQHLYDAIRDGSLAVGSAVLPSSLEMPVSILPLLGRESELNEIETCLRDSDSRLLSLVGPGGSGKTHLALEAAFRLGDAYADGVTVVSLAAIQTVESVAPGIAQACDLRLQPEQSSTRQLFDYLREKEMLLVLDNVEHLLQARPSAQGSVTDLFLDILRIAPRVRILATSRVRLNLCSERLLHVDGLLTPTLEVEAATLPAFPAIQLFLAAAKRVGSSYTPDSKDLQAIASLCRLLNGMPLAILLAAAWIEVLSPAQILEQVSRRYDFLEAEWQDLPPRQRSMRAVLDHSWGLLSTREQMIFPGLSVFHGGFTAAAAEQVAGVSLGDLIRLVGKSFLVRLPSGRYEMHELLRQYTEEKLARVFDSVRDLHSAYYLDMAQQRGEELKGPRQGVALTELEVEAENIRVAWEWRAMQGKIAGYGSALDGMCRLFERRGRCEEGISLCSTTVERLDGTLNEEVCRIWARLLAWQGAFERMAGRLERSDQLAEQSLGILDNVAGDTRPERAFALRVRGETVYRGGPRRRTEELYLQSLTLYQELDDHWSSARVLCDLGELALMMDQIENGERWLKASLQLRLAIGDQAGTAETLLFLCNHAQAIGHDAQGEQLAREAIHIYREMADEAGLARASFFLAVLFCFSGQFHEALPLLEDRIRFTRQLGQWSELAWAEKTMFITQVHLGMYEQARGLLGSAMAYFQESCDKEGMAGCYQDRAIISMLTDIDIGFQANYEAAYRYAEQSVRLYSELEHINLGEAYADLGFAAHCLGRHDEARQHLGEALNLVRRGNQMQTIPIVLARLAAILADSKPEQAVELYALAKCDPYVSNSRLWQDILETRVAAAATTLPQDIVQAAQARGQEGDWVTVTECWIRELGEDRIDYGIQKECLP